MPITEPKNLKGTRDFGPEEMTKRLLVLEILRAIFNKYGYDPIETPAIEYAETILGKYGEEGDKLTYSFKDNGDRDIALRYDQTVPTARFVAANWSNLPMPFKRYQIGPVWRADKPQKGRYREFVQCDIDIIGTTSLVADAEVAAVLFDVFKAIGCDDFVIRVNSRALLNDLLQKAGVKEELVTPCIVAIDKLDKTSVDKVKELILALGVDKAVVAKIEETILSEKVRNELSSLEGESAKSMQTFFDLADGFGVEEKNIMLDLTLARGLDYYTGTTYEVIIPDFKVGSLAGGGRYDNLAEMFSNKSFPGVGIAFGFDRIVLWMEEQGTFDNLILASEVLVVQFPDVLKENMKTLKTLQEESINAELYVDAAKMDKQLKYADKKRIPWVIIQGSQEVEKGEVLLRNMSSGEQESVTLQEAIEKIN